MRLTRFAVFGLGVLAVVVSIATKALAGDLNTVATPEIDGPSLSAGLSLLAAGVMIARAYRRK